MTATFSARRTDQPLQIGSRHGYRIDGDHACINAELSLPPYHPGGAWALQLWASEQPYQGGELTGVRVSEVRLELPTPLAPYTHRIEATVPARLPLQGRAYFMSLALVELAAGAGSVRDVASYPALETFPGPELHGEVGYELRGHEVLLQAAGVANSRGAGNLSGTLSLELWAWPVDAPQTLEAGQGVCLGAAQLLPVAGGERHSGLQCRAPFNEPPPGCYQLSLLLREWTSAHGYVTRDRRDFALPHRVAAPAAPVTLPEAAPAPLTVEEAPVAEPLTEQPIAEQLSTEQPIAEQPIAEQPMSTQAVALPEELELDWEVPESVATPPASAAVPRGSRAVSLNLSSLEDLARVKGLNTKLAKEIIRRRPWASIEQLIDVRGIGKRTLDKLRALVTL